MTAAIRYINYKELREAYLEVRSFIIEETGEEVDSLSTRIDEDLGLSGDDNYELLEKFVLKYDLSTEGFDYQKYFHTEYELFGSEAAFWGLIKFAIYSVLWLIRLLSFGKIKANEVKITILEQQRSVADMTVGDIVTWYLEKKYALRNDLKYVIA